MDQQTPRPGGWSVEHYGFADDPPTEPLHARAAPAVGPFRHRAGPDQGSHRGRVLAVAGALGLALTVGAGGFAAAYAAGAPEGPHGGGARGVHGLGGLDGGPRGR